MSVECGGKEERGRGKERRTRSVHLRRLVSGTRSLAMGRRGRWPCSSSVTCRSKAAGLVWPSERVSVFDLI